MQCQQNSSHYENIPMEEQIKEENFTDSIEIPCKSMEPSGLITSFNSIENWTNSEKFSPQAINANIQSNDSDCVSENSSNNENINPQPIEINIESNESIQNCLANENSSNHENFPFQSINKIMTSKNYPSMHMASTLIITSRMKQSKSVFWNKNNYDMMIQDETKENCNSMRSLKRNLSIPDNLQQDNRSFENTNTDRKRLKRTPVI